jgi:hypothetical protein
MATPKRKPVKLRNPVVVPVEKSVEDEVGESVSGTIFEYRGEGRVGIHRRDDYTKKFVFHGYLTPSDATEAKVAELFGGGDYRLQLRYPDAETGHESIRAVKNFRLPGSYKPPTTSLPGVGTPQAAPVVGTLPPGGIQVGSNSREMLDAAMTSQVMDLLKMSKEMRPSGDEKVLPLVMAQMQSMQAMLLKVMEVMATPRDVADPTANMIAMMGVMAEMFKSRERAEAPTDVTKLIEGMRALKDLSDDVNLPPGTTGDPLMDSIPRVLGVVEQLAAGQRRNNPPQGVVPVSTPTPLPVQSAMPLWQQLVIRSKGLLLNVASRGVDPAEAAQSMAVMMPEQHVGILKEMLVQPDAVSTLMNVIPELQNYPDWTKRFIATLQEVFREEEEEEEGEGPVDMAVSPE